MELDQETIYRISALQQQSQELEQNREFVEKQIVELNQFLESLNSFDKSEEKEMLSQFGKGIYVKTTVVDKKLYIDAGAGIIIRKTPKEASEIIENQISRLTELKMQLTNQLELYAAAMKELMKEIEEAQKTASKSK